MKFSALLLLPIFLVVLAHQAQSQNRFIVAVIERQRTMPSNNRTRCPGTIISERHVLTTAECAQPIDSSFDLMVQVQIRLQVGNVVYTEATTVSVNRVYVHPSRTEASNNVAVIRIDGRFNTTQLPPRNLGSLQSNVTCTLYGWYGAPAIPESVSVQVFSPNFCNPAQSQAYCSVLASSSVRACNAARGSPLVCSSGSVNGILLSPTACEYDQLGRPVLRFNSIGDSESWIKEVTGSAEITKFSVILLLSAVLVTLKNLA